MKKEKIFEKIDDLFDEDIINSWNIHKGKNYLKNLDFKKMKKIIHSWVKRKNKLNFQSLSKNKFYPDLIGHILGAKKINSSEAYNKIENITIASIGLPYHKLKGNPDYQKFILAIINYRIFIKKFSGGIMEYEKYIKENKNEKEILASFISPTTEYFFRDSLDNEMQLISERLPKKIKILVIGCATGSEVYSLSYVLDKLNREYNIKAIDINKPAIKIAKKGVYSTELLKKIPPFIKNELLDKKGNIKRKYKRNIHFKYYDIRNYRSREKFDLILSRNILKYFDEETKQKLIRKIFNNLLKFHGIAVFGIQRGSNSDVNPLKYIECKKIANYSFMN